MRHMAHSAATFLWPADLKMIIRMAITMMSRMTLQGASLSDPGDNDVFGGMMKDMTSRNAGMVSIARARAPAEEPQAHQFPAAVGTEVAASLEHFQLKCKLKML